MGRKTGRIVNIDRSTTTPDDQRAAAALIDRWKRYCPEHDPAKVLGKLRSELWRSRKLRMATRTYRLHAEMLERRKAGENVALLFPQPNNPPTRTQLRSQLIRKVSDWIRHYADDHTPHGDRPTVIATMVSDFLSTTCPDICGDVTPGRVRKLLDYSPKPPKARTRAKRAAPTA